jgi:hypothetical protein
VRHNPEAPGHRNGQNDKRGPSNAAKLPALARHYCNSGRYKGREREERALALGQRSRAQEGCGSVKREGRAREEIAGEACSTSGNQECQGHVGMAGLKLRQRHRGGEQQHESRDDDCDGRAATKQGEQGAHEADGEQRELDVHGVGKKPPMAR